MTQDDATSLQGSLDYCEPGRISGRVRFAADPQRRATVMLMQNATSIGQCIADRYRPDLADAGYADGRYGFLFLPEPRLTDAELRSVWLAVKGAAHVFAAGTHGPIPASCHAASIYRRPAEGRRLRRCILHIGTEKTGSSTLQAFLALNRAALTRRGYFLPLSLAPHAAAGLLNHVFLATLAMDDTVYPDDLRRSFGIAAPAALWSFRRDAFRMLEREIEAAPAACDTLVLSSEHCHSRLGPAAIAHLRQFLAPFCERFEVHVYLRPQHELAMSRHGMAVMLGHVDMPMFPHVPAADGGERDYFDYARLLARWADGFGEGALRPRIFDRRALRGGSVVEDFAAAMGTTMGGLARCPDQGGSISADAQRFLIRLYQTRGREALPPATRQWLSDQLRAVAPGHGIRPEPAAAAAFIAQFAASNEAVRQRWFPARATLFEIAPFPPPTPAPPDDDALMQTFLALLATRPGLPGGVG